MSECLKASMMEPPFKIFRSSLPPTVLPGMSQNHRTAAAPAVIMLESESAESESAADESVHATTPNTPYGKTCDERNPSADGCGSSTVSSARLTAAVAKAATAADASI